MACPNVACPAFAEVYLVAAAGEVFGDVVWYACASGDLHGGYACPLGGLGVENVGGTVLLDVVVVHLIDEMAVCGLVVVYGFGYASEIAFLYVDGLWIKVVGF